MSAADWQAQAYALAEVLSPKHWSPAVRAWMEHKGKKVSHWGIACSGGSDSLALLLLVWAHFKPTFGKLKVLHYHHGLRGAAAQADADFVQAVARALHLECMVGLAPIQANAHVNETTLRAHRLQFFYKSGCEAIFQGHHADDALATLMMRLARGSGTEGLAAPRAVHPHHACVLLRPFLPLSKAELQQALRHCGITWCEDATNKDARILRNRICLELLPVLKEIFGAGLTKAIGHSQALLEEDDAALRSWLQTLSANAGDFNCNAGDLGSDADAPKANANANALSTKSNKLKANANANALSAKSSKPEPKANALNSASDASNSNANANAPSPASPNANANAPSSASPSPNAPLDASALPEKSIFKQAVLQRSAFRGAPKALWRRALRLWLTKQGFGATLGRSAFEAVLAKACQGDSFRVSLGSRHFLMGSSDCLKIEPADTLSGGSQEAFED